MGRDLHYRPGSYYQTDDRTGFPTRAEKTRREWTGLQVGERYWDPRHPQELVKGVIDNQNVPIPRPLAPNVFVGPIFVQVTANAGPGATTLVVETISGLNNGDKIGIMTDAGIQFNTSIVTVGSNVITIADALVGYVSSGNIITKYGAAGP